MSTVRIALANIRVPATPQESVRLATSAVAEAGRHGALVICFPECFVPGYRWPGTTAPPPDPVFLERAWADVAAAARAAHITVILGTERVTDRGLQITACVINSDGTVAGWQDKGQIDPSEEAIILHSRPNVGSSPPGQLTFGVVICHEGWRYPETVRWAVRHARRSCSTHTRTSPNPAAIVPPRSPIPPTRFTRRRYCVVQRRTHVSSHR